MQREEPKYAPQKQVHEEPGVEERWVQLAIARIGMRLILDEAGIGVRMTAAAGLDKVGRIDWGVGVGFRQNIVGFMAVPATRRLNIAAQQP